MIILSWNVRGLGDTRRKSDIKLLIQKYRPDIVMLQETKTIAPTLALVREVWGHEAVQFEGVDALGALGGIWILWGILFLFSGMSWGIVNVCGLVLSSLKEGFLNDLGDLLVFHNVPFYLDEDFNFIRWPDESSSLTAINSMMRLFNSFIERFQLFDLPLAGANFTWSNRSESNLVMSKLDRFLVTHDWMEVFPLVSVKALPRLSSYHIPLLLNTCSSNSGSKPFRLELVWQDEPEVIDLIKSTWVNSISFGSVVFQLH
ncbi:hypothetical protein AMTRI_Chr11g156870 [Amborella trichopoda]